MIGMRCGDVRGKWDDYRIDNLGAETRRAMEDHLARCPACRELTSTIARAEALVRGAEMDPLLRRRIAVAVASGREAPSARPRFRPATAALLGGLAAAACLAALWFLPASEPAPARRQAAAAARESGKRAIPVAATPATSPPSIDAVEAPAVTEIFPGTFLAADIGAKVARVRADEVEARFVLERGRAVAVIGPHAEGFRFVVSTPDGAEVEALGTIFAVEVSASGGGEVRVLRGRVAFRAPGAPTIEVAAGQAAAAGAGGAAPADPESLDADRALAGFPGGAVAAEPVGRARAAETTAVELARRARDFRRERRFAEAAEEYRRLIARFPKSDAAANGQVALGEIELERLGQPGLALGRFERYLAASPSGYLAEAARAGRVRALVASSRKAEAVRAADEYLALHPHGPSAVEVARLRAAAGGGR